VTLGGIDVPFAAQTCAAHQGVNDVPHGVTQSLPNPLGGPSSLDVPAPPHWDRGGVLRPDAATASTRPLRMLPIFFSRCMPRVRALTRNLDNIDELRPGHKFA
jgi:hypothetical protein